MVELLLTSILTIVGAFVELSVGSLEAVLLEVVVAFVKLAIVVTFVLLDKTTIIVLV